MVILRFKQFSGWLAQSVNNWGIGYWFFMCDHYIQMAQQFHFPNMCRYGSNYLHLYLINYCIFVYTGPLLLLIMYLTFLNAGIPTVTLILIFSQIGSSPVYFSGVQYYSIEQYRSFLTVGALLRKWNMDVCNLGLHWRVVKNTVR